MIRSIRDWLSCYNSQEIDSSLRESKVLYWVWSRCVMDCRYVGKMADRVVARRPERPPLAERLRRALEEASEHARGERVLRETIVSVPEHAGPAFQVEPVSP